jgi:hypothetical protein
MARVGGIFETGRSPDHDQPSEVDPQRSFIVTKVGMELYALRQITSTSVEDPALDRRTRCPKRGFGRRLFLLAIDSPP